LVNRGACLGLTISCLVVQVSFGIPMGYQLTGTVTPVRGIFRFASTSWGTLAGDGFNFVTDGGTNTSNYAGQRAAGLTGMVYLNAYDNSSCRQTMKDAAIAQIVQTNVSGGDAGAVYQVGDEPTTNGCNAKASYTHMTSVIHAADPTARSWVADDEFNDPTTSHWPAGIPMEGSVDILAFDIYPCQTGPCKYTMIDLAVQRIHSAGLTSWEFILQDFGPCQSWRAPTAQEVAAQFEHWQGTGALGYWVYAYDSDPTPCPGNVAGSATLRQINALAVNPSQPSIVPTPAPTGIPSASESLVPSPEPQATSDAISRFVLSPIALIGSALFLGLIVVGLTYGRRRFR